MTNVDTGRYRIRPGQPADGAELARLQSAVQLQSRTGGQPHPGIAAWVEDLAGGHPSVTPADFLVAEDRATGRPAASLVALRQEWRLGGVPLPVAQIELVGTWPEHRGNRLTERMFAAMHAQHAQHAAGGVLLQIIEGIPYFYRRLGYDYALANDGAPALPVTARTTAGSAGATAGGAPRLRPATVADAEALAAVDQQADAGVLFCPRDAEVWRYEIAGRRPDDIARREVAVWERDGRVRGYLVHGTRLTPDGALTVVAATCADPADWPRAAPAMHAHLIETGQGLMTTIVPLLAPGHPLVRFGPPGVPRRPRGWYVRTTDAAALLARLQPLLRARWHDMRWPDPAMLLDLYGAAARLTFTDGVLTTVTAVPRPDGSIGPGAHAAIPPGALLQLALGHRTLPDVLATWPDCELLDRRTEAFLTAAFPRVPVHVWPRN